MSTRWKKGDTVQWNTPEGRTTGVVQKVVTRPVRVRGTRLEGSEDEPVYIVRCDHTGRMTGHRKVALKQRP